MRKASFKGKLKMRDSVTSRLNNDVEKILMMLERNIREI